MPAEIREMENREFVEGSDRLFIQGATVPLDKAGETTPAPNPPPQDPDDTGDSGDE